MTEEILNFMNNEVVSYIMDFVIAFGGVMIGILMIYNKTVKLFGDAKTKLNSAKTETVEQNKVVVENTKEIKLLQAKNDEVVSKVQQSNDIQLSKMKELTERNEAILAEMKELLTQFKPLINLPKAFIQTVINNPESVKSGVAKKVSDILEINTDNVEKNNKVGE